MRKPFFIIFYFFIHSAYSQIKCNNWLKTPSVPSYVGVGQLNIPGDHVTVEALVNRTTPYSGGQVWSGDIVSKHRDPTDVNYLLRPNSGEITTTNGYYKTPDIANINLNQTYHVAMVYDGDTLKFYRDGCLMSKIAAKGNLFQNSWETRIGYYAAQEYPNENLIGYVNEVRIWNVARTQQQIQTYMNSSLPNPTTQTGLLAYYTFDNLKNKQGNAAWNGTLGGSASINETNPNCNAIVNNCPVPPPCNIIITKNADSTVCAGSLIKMFATGGTSFSWSPSTGLSNPKISNPVATPLMTTKYYVTVIDASGCSKKDSVTIIVNPSPVIAKSNDTSICINSKIPLFASGGNSYTWSPSTGLNNPNSSNPIATPFANTKYYVTVTNIAGCSKKDSVKITVKNLPVISKSNDTSICADSKIPLFANGGTSYVWSPSTGLNNVYSSNPFATPLMTTKYYVTVSNGGCSKKDSIKIIVNNLPVISKSNDTSICLNSNASLFASGGTSYSWSPSSSLNNSTIANPVAKPLTNTLYKVKVTNADGCSKTASINVSIKPVAAITKSSDTTICNNSVIKIFASGGTSYIWSPATTLNNTSSSTPLASPKTSTIYHVKITDGQACVYNDSVKVSVRPASVFSVSADKQICTKTNQELSASGGDTYTWTPANSLDNPNTNNPIARPNQTTIYSVTIRENTCNDSATLFTKLTVLSSPIVKATKSNDISCNQSSTQLIAFGAIDYSWTPSSGLNNSAIANPVATPDASTIYKVIGKDQNGCTNSDSILVKVDYDKNVFYGLPNSFTPNGDGLNDCFGISHWGQVPQLIFSIYNRWGQVVFYTNNASTCWDGTFKGQPQNAGVFVYIIKAKTACGTIDRKGVITLLR